MSFYSKNLTKLIKSLPGEKKFGVYRFLPLFFLLGAALEFSMINWTVGETNFCKLFRTSGLYSEIIPNYIRSDRTFKKRQAKEIVEHSLHKSAISDSLN